MNLKTIILFAKDFEKKFQLRFITVNMSYYLCVSTVGIGERATFKLVIYNIVKQKIDCRYLHCFPPHYPNILRQLQPQFSPTLFSTQIILYYSVSLFYFGLLMTFLTDTELCHTLCPSGPFAEGLCLFCIVFIVSPVTFIIFDC